MAHSPVPLLPVPRPPSLFTGAQHPSRRVPTTPVSRFPCCRFPGFPVHCFLVPSPPSAHWCPTSVRPLAHYTCSPVPVLPASRVPGSPTPCASNPIASRPRFPATPVPGPCSPGPVPLGPRVPWTPGPPPRGRRGGVGTEEPTASLFQERCPKCHPGPLTANTPPNPLRQSRLLVLPCHLLSVMGHFESVIFHPLECDLRAQLDFL